MEKLFTTYPALQSCASEIERAAGILEKTARDGGTILFCGNGGSAADCSHIAGELLKGFLLKRPDPALPVWASGLQRGIRAISLPDQGAVLSAFANDVDAELVYAQLTYALGRPGDTLFGISTSGNAKNVSLAWEIAQYMGLSTVALVGASHCAADGLCDVVIHVPETLTYRVQELHLPVYHHLCATLEERLFGQECEPK